MVSRRCPVGLPTRPCPSQIPIPAFQARGTFADGGLDSGRPLLFNTNLFYNV
jgi:hypothetical protein